MSLTLRQHAIALSNGGHQEPLWYRGARAATIQVSSNAEEAHMHPYFFSQLYRERLAQYDREAEYRRHLPKRERRLLRHVGSLLTRSHRPVPLVASAGAKAHTCP
jgi:hypothetical protein